MLPTALRLEAKEAIKDNLGDGRPDRKMPRMTEHVITSSAKSVNSLSRTYVTRSWMSVGYGRCLCFDVHSEIHTPN